MKILIFFFSSQQQGEKFYFLGKIMTIKSNQTGGGGNSTHTQVSSPHSTAGSFLLFKLQKLVYFKTSENFSNFSTFSHSLHIWIML